MDEILQIPFLLPIQASHGGLAKSRGFGIHPDRTWAQFELIFVREGVLNIAEEDREFSVGANETLLLWPGRRHRGLTEYGADLSFFWLHFTIDPLPRLPQLTVLSSNQHIRIKRPDQMTALIRRFLDDQESIGVQNTSGALLIMLMLYEIEQSADEEAEINAAAAVLATQAHEMIQTKMHEPLSTSFLARALSCNPDYLGRVFRQVYGMTLTNAMHKYRIVQARKLLLETNLNIAEIAQRCGFDDLSYFRRVFRRSEGMNPRAYRQMYAHVFVNTE